MKAKTIKLAWTVCFAFSRYWHSINRAFGYANCGTVNRVFGWPKYYCAFKYNGIYFFTQIELLCSIRKLLELNICGKNKKYFSKL